MKHSAVIVSALLVFGAVLNSNIAWGQTGQPTWNTAPVNVAGPDGGTVSYTPNLSYEGGSYTSCCPMPNQCTFDMVSPAYQPITGQSAQGNGGRGSGNVSAVGPYNFPVPSNWVITFHVRCFTAVPRQSNTPLELPESTDDPSYSLFIVTQQ
jgi:hypothetical protein